MKLKSFFLLFFFFLLSSYIYGQGNRYVKVVERDSGLPLDSFEVSFYQVVLPQQATDTIKFILISKSKTNDNGIAWVPDSFSLIDKISAKDERVPIKYGGAVYNAKRFTNDTLTISIYKLPIN